MYCSNCGTKVEGNTKFCPNCGAMLKADATDAPVSIQNAPPAPAQTQPQPQAYAAAAAAPAAGMYAAPAQPQPQPQAYTQPAYNTGIAPGYSTRVNDPEIQAAMKKNSRASGIFGIIIVPLPLIGFVIYSLATGKMELKTALTVGGIVSAVFLLFALIGAASRKAAKPYEGTVTDKKERQVDRHRNDSSRNDLITEYTTVVLTTDGKTKKIVEHEGSMIIAWDYLKIGDRFRYHPQFNFPYELYDKSRAPYIGCVSCGTKNSPADDRCKKCGIPLLK